MLTVQLGTLAPSAACPTSEIFFRVFPTDLVVRLPLHIKNSTLFRIGCSEMVRFLLEKTLLTWLCLCSLMEECFIIDDHRILIFSDNRCESHRP